MSASGIIFSNLNDTTLSRLTPDRTVAAIPFGCRYRLVDFALSNMVNSDIIDISIVANYNYRSLVEHIGSGKDWDLARRAGGVKAISPYQCAHSADAPMYSHRLEAILSMSEHIAAIRSDVVVLSDCDNIVNIDLNAVISVHRANGADVTVVTAPCTPTYLAKVPQMMLQTDDDGRIVDIVKSVRQTASHPERSLNIFVMDTAYLQQIVEVAKAHNYHSMTDDILMKNTKDANYYTYCYRGFVAPVGTFIDYYQSSIRLATDPDARLSLLGRKERPIFTRVHNSAPCLYKGKAEVINSMIADDCVIEGHVENSILFRGVKVGRGAVVKNSILFGNCTIGENSSVNCIVADKSVTISDSCHLSGHDTLPFYVGKGKHV